MNLEMAMPVEPATPTVSFAELRRDRFFSVTPVMRKDIEYVEQLAVQTSTNIDSWDVVSLLDSITPGDRRAINKKFFAKADSQKKETSTLDDATAKLINESATGLERARRARIDHLSSDAEYALSQAREYDKNAQKQIKKAWDYRKEIMVLEGARPDAIAEDVRKILQEGFFKLHKVENACVELLTSNDIVMTEVNAAAKVNRRVGLGQYRAVLNLSHMQLTLHRHKRNRIFRGIYHPYVSSTGSICWGTAQDTARNMLSTGRAYDVLSLLSALLTTYGTGTPYASLAQFETVTTVTDIDEVPDVFCDYCEELEDDCECERCDTCGEVTDQCECYHCGICETTQRHAECGCCQECENTEGNCTCCSICEGDTNDCGCCHDCGNTAYDCTRCGECDNHIEASHDHSTTCSGFVPDQAESTVTDVTF